LKKLKKNFTGMKKTGNKNWEKKRLKKAEK